MDIQPVKQMIPVCQLLWDSTAFEHEVCPNPRLPILPLIVESIQRDGYRMNGDGVIQVTRLADKYLVITGRLKAMAAVMCKVPEVPALIYPDSCPLEIMRYKSVSPKLPQKELTWQEMLDCSKYIVKQGGLKKDLIKVFGVSKGRKLWVECRK